MSFCESIFQKEIYKIEISDLIAFFSSEQEESSVMEFKSGKVEIDDIYREVSAFLNTEGGILIIGSPQEKKVKSNNKEKKVCQGDLIPSKISNQDNLLRCIASNISPAPYKIKIKELEYKDGKIYILEIPQSMTPPHQVNNEGKYYIRLEREAKPAPHGIVEALFFKRQKADLNLEFDIYRTTENPEIIYVELKFSNNSLVTAENIGFMLEMDGVEEILVKENVKREILQENGLLKHQDNFGGTILVKGIGVSLMFGLALKNNIFWINCSYWCMGLQAEKKAAIFDTGERFGYINRYDSKINDNECSFQELYDEYFKKEI
jgi:hypothetical protein